MAMTFILFIYLQLLDLLSTIACLKFGGVEGNPFVRLLMRQFDNPLNGLLVAKFLAIFVGYITWEFCSPKILLWINIMFAIVVVWNLLGLLWGGR